MGLREIIENKKTVYKNGIRWFSVNLNPKYKTRPIQIFLEDVARKDQSITEGSRD